MGSTTKIGHVGGLCNRLDVMATGLLYTTTIAPSELEIQWPLTADMPVGFGDLFTHLPGGTVVEAVLEPEAVATFARINRSLPPDYRDTPAYRDILRRIVAGVAPAVREPVEQFKKAHFPANARVVGVHVRRCEGPHISPFAQPLRYYEAMMRRMPRDTSFFISTDSQEAFRWLRGRFGGRVFQKEKPADNRHTVEGVREGFVDMLLLSQCDSLIGTYDSSFSAIAAFAGGRPLAMVKWWPRLPPGWKHFNALSWLWTYRHFFRESTIWQRTWRYSVVRGPVAGHLRNVKHQLTRRPISRPA